MWVCIALGVVGMYFLCVSETSALNFGDFMLILCAVCFGVHIMIIDHFVKKVDGVRLSLVQFFVVGVLSLVTALIFETIDFALIKAAFISIFYAGVLSSGVAYTLQIVSQKNLANNQIELKYRVNNYDTSKLLFLFFINDKTTVSGPTLPKYIIIIISFNSLFIKFYVIIFFY